MKGQETIKKTFERNARALRLRPSVGQGTAVTKARIREGLTCDVHEGPWRLTVDMSEKSGGADLGPNPGVLGRGALASCLAIGYTMWAAKLGVDLESVEVEVHADYDSRGYHGIDDVAAGYRRLRYVVNVESEASRSEILRVLDQADATSPYFDVFTRAQELGREVHLHRPVKEEE